ncbi:unnamed protein product [Coffea canephora]|uniref:DH200=94 genomic scaffold, scaffold_454 n=1 Tax=Coffea canephora TaxID=49390 RepID=A0A068VI61_COFCA|nr:unnamed protein product [Coffea canephora]
MHEVKNRAMDKPIHGKATGWIFESWYVLPLIIMDILSGSATSIFCSLSTIALQLVEIEFPRGLLETKFVSIQMTNAANEACLSFYRDIA